jgi:glycosyltransferase involved in cell wall biosynthesis
MDTRGQGIIKMSPSPTQKSLFPMTNDTEQACNELAVSIVIPCLNESTTIADAVAQARAAFHDWPAAVEVIVADNGSKDGSIGFARHAGARIVVAAQQGYGAALQAGFAAARSPCIVYADADLTYDFSEAPKLVRALREHDADMVLGTRIRGYIQPGAMPVLHRRLGTPTLTSLINRLFNGSLTDCNSGFRAFRRDRLAIWRASSPGMEYASELLVNALIASSRIVEVPVTLRRERENRRSHLETWRDGMRHLLTILARAPWLFVNGGIVVILVSAIIAAACAFGPRVVLGTFALFDYHTLIFTCLLGFAGTQTLGIGLLLELRQERPVGRLATILLDLHEGVLFWSLAVVVAGVGVGASFVAWSWAKHGFSDISYLKLTLFLLYIATVVGSFAMSIFHVHLLKRV